MTIHTPRALLAAFVASLSYVLAAPAGAQDANQPATLRLDETLKIPGATLPADEYIFTVTHDRDGDVVRITRTSDRKLVATARVERVERASDIDGLAIEVAFPSGADEWPTMKGWSYPDAAHSYEFVFSKAQMRRLAHEDTTEIPLAPPTPPDIRLPAPSS
jgi:hypothetical protein